MEENLYDERNEGGGGKEERRVERGEIERREKRGEWREETLNLNPEP